MYTLTCKAYKITNVQRLKDSFLSNSHFKRILDTDQYFNSAYVSHSSSFAIAISAIS